MPTVPTTDYWRLAVVPLASQDEEAMKFGVAEKCMQLVGMVRQATR
jgi:hypothetical protein